MLIPIQFSKDFNYLKSLTYVHCKNLNFPTNSTIEPSHTIFYPYNITDTDRHSYETRNAENLESLCSRHSFVTNSICYMLPKFKNSCPICIKEKICTHSISGFQGI